MPVLSPSQPPPIPPSPPRPASALLSAKQGGASEPSLLDPLKAASPVTERDSPTNMQQQGGAQEASSGVDSLSARLVESLLTLDGAAAQVHPAGGLTGSAAGAKSAASTGAQADEQMHSSANDTSNNSRSSVSGEQSLASDSSSCSLRLSPRPHSLDRVDSSGSWERYRASRQAPAEPATSTPTRHPFDLRIAVQAGSQRAAQQEEAQSASSAASSASACSSIAPGAASSASACCPCSGESSDASDTASKAGSSAMQLATPQARSGASSVSVSVSVAATTAKDGEASAMELSTPANKKQSAAAQEEAAGGAASSDAIGALQSEKGKNGSNSDASSSSSPSSEQARYKPIRTLQQSLFGQVQLAFDNRLQCMVAIKVSHAKLVNGARHSATSTAKSQAGVSVLEDVRREARILRLLAGSDGRSRGEPPKVMELAAIDQETCGLSPQLLAAIHDPRNTVEESLLKPSIQQQFLNSLNKGRRSIAEFYEEAEAENFHYLISQYVDGGDLFSVLTAQPQHKVSESVARSWFYQLCCSVRYLHSHSIAHLDLSLENVCLDAKTGRLALIDFGLAAQHPRYKGASMSLGEDGAPLRNTSPHIKLLDEKPGEEAASDAAASSSTVAPCDCRACAASAEKLRESDRGLRNASARHLARLKYLCRPVCEKVHKPGKLGYMAPELYNGQVWDAYKHDVFALGVILYSMLTGRPPFTRPDEAHDVWFKVLFTGQWLLPAVASQPPAQIYAPLSANAKHLIDMLLKPQHMRPTVDQLMKHPFFQADHPGNEPPVAMPYFPMLDQRPRPRMADRFPRRAGSS